MLQIVTRISPADELAEDLIEGRIEAIIGNRWHHGQIPGAIRVHLGCLSRARAVRKGHPVEKRKGLTTTDLAAFPVASAVQTGAFICNNFHILRDTVLERSL